MAEEGNKKEVRYSEWCNKCKYGPLEEWKDPCNECLTTPYNYDSHKPIKYKEAEK